MLMMLPALGKPPAADAHDAGWRLWGNTRRQWGKRQAADAHDAGGFGENPQQLMLMMLEALGTNAAAVG